MDGENPMLKNRTASNDTTDSGYIDPLSDGEAEEVMSDGATSDGADGTCLVPRRERTTSIVEPLSMTSYLDPQQEPLRR